MRLGTIRHSSLTELVRLGALSKYTVTDISGIVLQVGVIPVLTCVKKLCTKFFDYVFRVLSAEALKAKIWGARFWVWLGGSRTSSLRMMRLVCYKVESSGFMVLV